MRLYKKRFLGRGIERKVANRVETKDAMVWDVFPTTKTAWVRIQGSDTNIIAYYPEGWEQTPFWLKKGCVVKINFTGGNRNRVELIGQGNIKPTWTTGTVTTPTLDTSEDTLLTGGHILPIPGTPRMSVIVTDGSYRIGGVTYYLGGSG